MALINQMIVKLNEQYHADAMYCFHKLRVAGAYWICATEDVVCMDFNFTAFGIYVSQPWLICLIL